MRTAPIDDGFEHIFETWRLRHNAILWPSLDCSYLCFALPGPDNVANRFAEQRPGEWRGMRYRSARGIGFVLTDNGKALFASIIATDRDGTSELDRSTVGIARDDLRTGAPRAPVAQFPPGARQRAAVIRCLRLAVVPPRGLQRRFDQPQTVLSDKVWVVRSRPIRQIVDEMVLVYECSAHPQNMGVTKGIIHTRGPEPIKRDPRS
jgi:hypothetical protein